MKTMKIRSLIGAFFIVMLMSTVVSFAQQGNGYGKRNGNGNGMRYHQKSQMMNMQGNMLDRIPDITEDQKAKIKTLRNESMKQMLPLRNELAELKAHQRTLCTATDVDTKAINKQIDKRIVVKAKIMKLQSKTHQDIRALLTEDQRVFFDTHHKMGKKGYGHHNRACRN